jgi:hypothetical protein
MLLRFRLDRGGAPLAPMVRPMMRNWLGVLTIAATLLVGASAHATVFLDYSDVQTLGRDVAQSIGNDPTVGEALQTALAAQGVASAQIAPMRAAALRRLVKDAQSYAGTLEGRGFPDMAAADEAVQKRLVVLRFDAMNDPRGYASGKPLGYAVNDAEAARLVRALPATFLEHQATLRADLEQSVQNGEMDEQDFAAVSSFARDLCIQQARATIEEIKGARFFHKLDADMYVGNAVDAAIESIRSDRLADPDARPRFLDQAKLHLMQHGATSAIDNDRTVR